MTIHGETVYPAIEKGERAVFSHFLVMVFLG